MASWKLSIFAGKQVGTGLVASQRKPFLQQNKERTKNNCSFELAVLVLSKALDKKGVTNR